MSPRRDLEAKSPPVPVTMPPELELQIQETLRELGIRILTTQGEVKGYTPTTIGKPTPSTTTPRR